MSARITTKNVSTIANYIPINISHVLLSTTIDATIKCTILHAQFTTRTWHASLLFQRNGISITIHIHLRTHKPVIGIQWKSMIIGRTRREGKRFTRDTCTWCGCRACEKKRKKKKIGKTAMRRNERFTGPVIGRMHVIVADVSYLWSENRHSDILVAAPVRAPWLKRKHMLIGRRPVPKME